MHARALFLPLMVISLLAIVAACGDTVRDDDDTGGRFAEGVRADTESAGPGANEARDGALAVDSDETSRGDEASPALALQAFDRKIIFTAGLDLEVEDVARAFNDVSRIASSHGGFVEGSSLSLRSERDGERREFGWLNLRIPISQYQDTLLALRTLRNGVVVSEESQATEITEEYSDTQSRIHNLEATEARYLALLAEAETVEDILRVDDRIRPVRLEIDRLRGRLNLLDDLTEMASVNVTLAPREGFVVPAGGSSTDPGEAFVNAWEASLDFLYGLATVLAYLSVVAIWAGPMLVAGFVATRIARRWREPSTP